MTGRTVPPAGDGDAPTVDDAVADGEGVATGGGRAMVHCTSTTPAATMHTGTATHRPKGINWDESSRGCQRYLQSIGYQPVRAAQPST